MPRYLIDCELAGAGFAGTQVQAGARTVQGELMRVAAQLNDGVATAVRPASRLDSGVDAQHLPCDLQLEREWPLRGLVHAFTKALPGDLCVRRAARVDDGFHAIHRAVSKTYRYAVVVRGARPARDLGRWWVCRPLDPARLHAAAALLPGARDLGAFACLRHDGSDDDDPVRTIHHAGWTDARTDHDPAWIFRITGSGFLYRQVRALVGAMVHTAGPYGDPAAFAAAVAGGRGHPRPGDVAPAAGLCLEQVRYDPEPEWTWA